MNQEEPVFPSLWHFRAANVLFGVDAVSGALLLGRDGAETVWVCWTDQTLAEHQLPQGYALRQGAVRQVLPQLPTGTGVRVDPGLASGLVVPGSGLADLVAACSPFPAGVSIDVGTLEPVPSSLAEGLRRVLEQRSFVESLWLFRHRIEDGPVLGCVVYESGPGIEARESAVAAVSAALDRAFGAQGAAATTAPVVGFDVVALTDLPEEIREWVSATPQLAVR